MSRRRTRPVMKRTEDPCSRQIAYSRCREGILKKAAELSVFSNADIGLLMFSTTVLNGSFDKFLLCLFQEDMFLRFIEEPDDDKKASVLAIFAILVS
ncbi:hypothetical protein Gogos_006467 [Gossypium gossypioides]|uniref:MADS-box domain-containing protein n=1 Tax=Gossypium gossypioides TaxID=34282 RepID=A0A7J9C5P9_GOSGO|nr:hypothetical protein [Gossypium gossypioides]